jgi:hypothetical protein
VQGNNKNLKQKACLEACKQLHLIGALTDNLVPDVVEEEAVAQEISKFCLQPFYYWFGCFILSKHYLHFKEIIFHFNSL